MDPALFTLHLANGLVTALGDLALLSLLFWLVRIRLPRLRQLLLGLAIVHVCAASLMLSPYGLIGVDLAHDGNAGWYGLAQFVDRVAMALWGGICLWLLVRRSRRAAAGHRLFRSLAGLQDEGAGASRLHRCVQLIAARMGMLTPPVLTVPGTVVTPFVVGFRRPVLVLPEEVCAGLDDRELQSVVAHELAHLRGRDVLVIALLELVRALLFFNGPLLTLISRYKEELEKVRDLQACQLTGSPRPLARSLVKVLRMVRHGWVTPSWAGTSTLVRPSRRRTRRRLSNLLWAGRRRGLSVVLLQVLLLLLLFPGNPLRGGNSVSLRQVAGAGAPGHHSTLHIGLRVAANPIHTILLRILIDRGGDS